MNKIFIQEYMSMREEEAETKARAEPGPVPPPIC